MVSENIKVLAKNSCPITATQGAGAADVPGATGKPGRLALQQAIQAEMLCLGKGECAALTPPHAGWLKQVA